MVENSIMHLINRKLDISIFIFILIASVFRVSVLFIDGDFWWQSYLGKEILCGNFVANVHWGTLGAIDTINYEWLSSLLFSLFSKNWYTILFLKFILCLFVGIVNCIFLNKFSNENKTGLCLSCLVILCTSITCFNLKAYIFSIAFYSISIIIFYDYKENRNFLKYLVYTCILVLLWNNLHSGSIILYFVVATLFWLCYLRDFRTLIIGFCNFLILFVNPYGYKLPLFIFTFTTERTKLFISEWYTLDFKTLIGKIFVFLLLIGVYSISKDTYRGDLFKTSLFCLQIILCFMSTRHIMFMITSLVLVIGCTEYKEIELASEWLKILNILNIILLCCIIISVIFSDKKISQFSDKLKECIIETNENDNDGLFADATTYTLELGIKPFISSYCLDVIDRYVDTIYIEDYSTDKEIEDFIDYYGLNKFLVRKKATYFQGYSIEPKNHLYNYLLNNEKYDIIYEDDIFCYFIED